MSHHKAHEMHPLGIAVLTVSDTRTAENDTSGDLLVSRLKKAGHTLIDRSIVRDEAQDIHTPLKSWIQHPDIDVILSTGGTGITGRDITPEVFRGLFDKEIEGFGELFRMLSYQTIGTSTLQSRAVAGVAGKTLLFALPGSTGACKDAWDMILHQQLDSRHKPCNFAELLPRLGEE